MTRLLAYPVVVDLLIGGAGGDLLQGLAGNDTLNGGAGADEMHGDGGNDILTGDTGRDFFFGDDGNDTFVFDLDFSDLVSDGDDFIFDFNDIVGSDFDFLKFTGVSGTENLDAVEDISEVVNNDGDAKLVFDLNNDAFFDDASITFINIAFVGQSEVSDLVNVAQIIVEA